MEPDVRHAIAAVVRRDDELVLAVLRPDEPGEELPGVWGLPAATLRAGESPEDAVCRIGREKLGVLLEPMRAIGSGEQDRDGYRLRMTVYEASIGGEPRLPARTSAGGRTLYDGIDWLPLDSLREAAERGSLCCEVLVRLAGRKRARQ